jgi:hypothetical protein
MCCTSKLEVQAGWKDGERTVKIAPCRTYHARTVGTNLLRMPDGRSVFKIYYISVIGRDRPELFEWEHSQRSPSDFERDFLAGAHEGIGFVIAFPHVTKIYRFSPEGETILDVKEFDTAGMVPRDCSRAGGYHEFACYAEAVLAADEYRLWAAAATVDAYLATRSEADDFPVGSNVKLAAWWA